MTTPIAQLQRCKLTEPCVEQLNARWAEHESRGCTKLHSLRAPAHVVVARDSRNACPTSHYSKRAYCLLPCWPMKVECKTLCKWPETHLPRHCLNSLTQRLLRAMARLQLERKYHNPCGRSSHRSSCNMLACVITAGQVSIDSVAPRFSHRLHGRCTEFISLRPASVPPATSNQSMEP